ncbi:MAG: IPT/TIG domain-containing protein, partial [Ferruginibacter sp.]|nr:IPT/TIG domain-containing protein [Cytophagales bacterium]
MLVRFAGFCLLLIVLLQSCAEVFELPAPVPPPRITGVRPDRGVADVAVIITGENFSTTLANNAVKFNGKPATVTRATATQLTALVPAHAGTGTVEVVVRKKATTGPAFTFFETPVVAGISPDRGPAGTVVTLRGNYFDTTAANNTVRFGGQVGEDFNWRAYGRQFERNRGFDPNGPAFDDWRQARGGFRGDWTPTADDTVTIQGDIYEGYSGRNQVTATLAPPFQIASTDDYHVSGGNTLA